MKKTHPVIVNSTRIRKAGFTLLELLITVAIIGILAALILPMRTTGHRSVRAHCMSNIKYLAVEVVTYAMENRDRLPQMQQSNWLWDMPVAVADAISTNGFGRSPFYDPGFYEMEAMWNSGTNATHPFHTIGYALTFAGTASLIPSNSNPAIVPQPLVVPPLMLPEVNPARRVLMAGATISASGECNVTNRMANHYTGVSVGKLKARSAHLDTSGKIPVGDNVAMLDGSARWVRFTDMVPRTTGSGPVFWW